MSRLEAFTVKESNGQSYWTKLGVAFPMKSGKGYNLILDAIPAPVDGSYKLVLLEPKENSNSGKNEYSNYNSSSGRPGKGSAQTEDDDIPF